MRSALKYWLEQLGFDVQASEYAGFEHAPDRDAIEACFENVRSSELYVLLIGVEKGTCIERDGEQVSITQGEYRVAYLNYQQTGKPKIVSFVRQAMEPIDKDFTTRFIREVRRVDDDDKRSNLTIPSWDFATLLMA